MVREVIIPALVLLGCAGCADPPRSGPTTTQAEPPGENTGGKPLTGPARRVCAERAPEVFSYGAFEFRLRQGTDRCELAYRTEGTGWNRRRLDLSPPCYLFRWQSPLPPNSSPANGEPLGELHGPQVYRYAAEATVAMAIAGDPQTADELHAMFGHLPQAERKRVESEPCGATVQAILLVDGQLQLPSKQPHRGRFCANGSLEPQNFWVLTHPAPERGR